MPVKLLGFFAALCCGAAICYGNYRIAKTVLKRHEDKFVLASWVRQLISIGYLVLLYFVGQNTPLDVIWLMIGGAVGVTVPLFFLTPRLLEAARKDKDGKEDDNG